MNNSIEIKNLTKKYTNFTLNNINLDIKSGSIIGLIGENGAGKTTLIKSILNLIKPDNGEIKIFGKDINSNEREIKEDIGVVLDNAFFPEIFKVRDIAIVMRNTYKNWDDNLFNKYLLDFNIPNQKISTLSKGMKKKLEILTALSHHPKLLILDEPTSGLDPVFRDEILDIFLDFIGDEEHTILLSSHITSDLEKVSDYIVFINKGEVVLDEEKDTLIENYGIVITDEETFNKIDKEYIVRYKKNRYNYEILTADKTKLKKKYKDLEIDKPTVEQIMIMYIKGAVKWKDS